MSRAVELLARLARSVAIGDQTAVADACSAVACQALELGFGAKAFDQADALLECAAAVLALGRSELQLRRTPADPTPAEGAIDAPQSSSGV